MVLSHLNYSHIWFSKSIGLKQTFFLFAEQIIIVNKLSIGCKITILSLRSIEVADKRIFN